MNPDEVQLFKPDGGKHEYGVAVYTGGAWADRGFFGRLESALAIAAGSAAAAETQLHISPAVCEDLRVWLEERLAEEVPV